MIESSTRRAGPGGGEIGGASGVNISIHAYQARIDLFVIAGGVMGLLLGLALTQGRPLAPGTAMIIRGVCVSAGVFAGALIARMAH